VVNSGTASTAEIVAGALQDTHRATLVGETTFDTGTMLNSFPLSDGSVLLLAQWGDHYDHGSGRLANGMVYCLPDTWQKGMTR
jgi:C-terminal processing protease CtpA/Prc